MDERREILDYLWKNGIVPTPDELDKIIKNGGIEYVRGRMEKRREKVDEIEIIKSREYFEATSGKSDSFKKLFQDRYVKIKKFYNQGYLLPQQWILSLLNLMKVR
jgi:hypothetical protein